VGEEVAPPDRRGGVGRVAPDEGELAGGEVRVLLGPAIERQPEREPDEPERPGGDERHRHPYVMVIHGTTIGVMTAPTLLPALKMPVASARSFFGNHSAMVLIEAGNSPTPPARAQTARRKIP